MAVPPTIPTSFVPKQPTVQNLRKSAGGTISVLMLIGIVLFVLSIVAAVGVFFYANYLKGVASAKDGELAQAQSGANTDTIQQLVRLQNRLNAAEQLLGQHVELSQFFDLLESITLENVRFSGLTVSVAADRSATLQMNGTALDFNALAAESKAFAAQPDLKSAIFSNIAIDPTTGNATFQVNATLDQKVVQEAAPPSQASAAAAAATSSLPTNISLPTVAPATTTAAASGTASASSSASTTKS